MSEGAEGGRGRLLCGGRNVTRQSRAFLPGSHTHVTHTCHSTAASTKALACTTALHRLLLLDGFKVVETAGPADTADTLAAITR